MKITFVGSGHGVPSAQRYCSAVMVEVGASIYFIDAGAPIMDELLRMGRDINNVRAVFITHCHGDHLSGLPNMADLADWYYKDAKIGFYLPEQSTIDAIEALIVSTHGGRPLREGVDFYQYDEGFVYQDENIKLTAIPNKHIFTQNRPSYCFLVEADGKRVLFSGDLSQHLALEDFPKLAMSEELDAFVCEMAHFTMDMLKPYLRKCTAKAVYFNHVYPLDKFNLIEAEDASGEYPFKMHIAKDRDEILL